MLRFLNTYLPLILLIGIVYVFRAPLWVVSHQAIREVAPCRIPITYEIDTIDPRFDVSKTDVEKAARDAVAVWEKAAGRDLFTEIATGTPIVDVNLQYDVRQQTTETLKDLGSQISTANSHYDTVDSQYEARRAAYLSKKSAFEANADAFNQDAAAYQKEVDGWNAKGGAPQSVVSRLNAEKRDLETRQAALAAQQNAVNALADEVNALAQQLNAMAKDINSTARTYNRVGAQTGEEFEEGVYESSAGHESITVYEFDSQARLTRLLAHEFGHALGLDHVEGTDSIMYRLNQGSNIVPTAEDRAALNAVCRIAS